MYGMRWQAMLLMVLAAAVLAGCPVRDPDRHGPMRDPDRHEPMRRPGYTLPAALPAPTFPHVLPR